VRLMKKNIPNLITCLNLLCGCAAVTFAFHGRLDMTAYLTALALVFDFADGMIARLLHVHSELGKQLDSLADVISFGLVPGVVVYHLLLRSSLELISTQNSLPYHLIPYFGFVITAFSAIRLAKFNIDTRQSDSFIGLPTPANTMVFVSLPLILMSSGSYISSLILNPYFLIILSSIMSWMLIAEIPLFALKFKSFGWKENRVKYLFLIVCLVLLCAFLFAAVPILIFLYILISFMLKISEKKKSEVSRGS
jgi:CDP-diacylglycerol--serine O-phosphatidyltransferase